MKKILLVDDLGIDVLLTRLAIEEMRFPHQLTVARDGEEAFALATGERFDLLILDIKMPRVDGFEFLARWRAHDGSDAPVVIVSGSGLDADRRRAQELNAAAYIQKAVDFSAFKAELKATLQRLKIA